MGQTAFQQAVKPELPKCLARVMPWLARLKDKEDG
jgi:hypothetical protein